MLGEFLKVAAAGAAPILPIVFGLTNFYGKAGLTGKWQLLAAFLTGSGAGILYILATLPPTNFSSWVYTGIFSVAMGLIPSGCYEGMKAASEKGMDAAMGKKSA
jgi:hypothetical protein